MLARIEDAFAARTASEDRLRRFVADASHELRTPLTSIRGYTELFEMGVKDRPEDLATAMHHIRGEAERMRVLVEDLLLLAHPEHARVPATDRVDLAEVAAQAVAGAQVAAADRRFELSSTVPVFVTGDAYRLRQVVDNLVHNAVEHAAGDVEVSVGTAAGVAVLAVRDHGPGIAEEDAGRIFEPFYRADPSRSRGTGGAGLGLAIVAGIVESHGGTVAVDSATDADGPGAIFTVRLPLAGEDAGHATDDKAPRPDEVFEDPLTTEHPPAASEV
jgi:two-component system OmpR family sensor kinase